MIAKAAKSMHTFDLVSQRSGSILFDQLATAGGSRAAAEGKERGLDTGISDRACDLTLEQKSCAKGGVRTARVGVRTLGVRTAEKVLEHC